MRFIRSTGALLLVVLPVGCGPNEKDRTAGTGAKSQIEGNANELIVGKWDYVNEPPNHHLVDRSEYTRDGKYRFWFLKKTAAGLKTLEDKDPAEPVNEGSYRFIDERTFTVTTTNGNVTTTSKSVIESLSKDKLVIVTEEGRKLGYARAK